MYVYVFMCMFVYVCVGDLHGPAARDEVHGVCGGGQARGSQGQAGHHR